MTDIAQTPDQPVQASGQQAPAAPAAPAEDWKSRYDGLVRKVEQLVTEGRAKDNELATLRTQIEQLNAQLGLKDVEKSVAVSERDKQIQELVSGKSTAEKELARLQALELKLKVATELGRPELMKIAQTIPDVPDEEALRTIMKSTLDLVDDAVKAREQQILGGVVPAAGIVPAAAGAPQSEAEWLARLERTTDPRDRSTILDEYGDWLQSKHSRS